MNDNKIINSEHHTDETVAINALSEMIKGAIEPVTSSQKFVAEERTKQTTIIGGIKLKMFWGIVFLVTLILILAAFAMYLNKDEISEKIIIAIVSFLGGIGIGKQTSK